MPSPARRANQAKPSSPAARAQKRQQSRQREHQTHLLRAHKARVDQALANAYDLLADIRAGRAIPTLGGQIMLPATPGWRAAIGSTTIELDPEACAALEVCAAAEALKGFAELINIFNARNNLPAIYLPHLIGLISIVEQAQSTTEAQLNNAQAELNALKATLLTIPAQTARDITYTISLRSTQGLPPYTDPKRPNQMPIDILTWHQKTHPNSRSF
jgi:hypothetical protein